MKQNGSLLGGILLIAGTTIGGGMLALPVLTCLGGFVPSLFIYLCCWLFMATTGLLFLEVSLSLHKEANILSMAKLTLGKWGKAFAWMLYLFLFYCLTLAYTIGCGSYLLDALGIEAHPILGPVIFLGIFAPIVIVGTRIVSAVNGTFVAIMAILFVLLVCIGIPYIDLDLLQRRDWPLSLMSLPIAFTAFAYQGTVPTLIHYLDRDVKKVRYAILIGSFIPFITYIIWQAVILGIVPTFGPGGLLEAMTRGDNAVRPLRYFIENPWLLTISGLFGFIALLTSFFGVTLGLVDFLADGLKISKRTVKGKLTLGLLVFVPPLLIAMWKSNLFLQALDLAGGYGCSLLLGLLPVMMVWQARYHLFLDTPYKVWGGKLLLIILGVFVLVEVTCQIGITLELFPKLPN